MNDPIPNEFRRPAPTLKDAVEPIAAGSNPHDMTDEHDIGDALTFLADSGEPVSIYPSSATNVVMARIKSVDPENPYFVVELNEGEFLPPGDAVFVAWMRSSKIQFKLSSDTWSTLPEQPTMLPLEFPLKCNVLNRRASTRLETPLGVYYMASFVMNGKPYELQLYDFSAGGVGMRAAPRDAVGLHVGKKLQRVRLELGPDSVMIADLEVRLSRTFRSFLLGEQVQIGCQFINLSPMMEEELKRLLDKLNSNKYR
ncbi:c-di-GMP-binding flagellar brake protein YcgR, contains PilZNR and PilZ domains [Duganella sacchari]|uniref:C-di-GMP-binding flagellar brake protein YcgR, contains PilZNR and PilZ domains n=2 Tax=Duganella sacchari TaxID=551987 RepID=A0A1M7P737_9BURK|nr:c-di-GMP-binding flagellar brake protein YcgR, contains PilZNR and PilZ domains [Duganella sacchari]